MFILGQNSTFSSGDILVYTDETVHVTHHCDQQALSYHKYPRTTIHTKGQQLEEVWQFVFLCLWQCRETIKKPLRGWTLPAYGTVLDVCYQSVGMAKTFHSSFNEHCVQLELTFEWKRLQEYR